MNFTFDDYTVRKIEDRDVDYITQLIAGDEYHRDKMTADFFTKLRPGEDAWALEDMEHGKVVFYFKTTVAARIDIQFAPLPKSEVMAALMRGMAWLEVQLVRNGFRELFFDPQGPELEQFAKRRLGFTEAPPTLVRPLRMPKVAVMESKPVESLSTNRLERDGTD